VVSVNKISGTTIISLFGCTTALEERNAVGDFQKRMADRHEKDVEDLWPESKRTIASGAKYEKGDLKTAEVENISFVVECKCTQKASYSITEKVWDTVKEHAQNRSWTARPALAIRLYGPTKEETEWGGERVNLPEALPVKQDLVVLDLNDFLEFYEEYLELKRKSQQ
jgi:hypothetical protein